MSTTVAATRVLMQRGITGIVASLLLSWAVAGMAAEEARWFSIELIVFEQTMNPAYAEHWNPKPQLSYPKDLVRFPSASRHHSQPDMFLEMPFDAHLSNAKAKLIRARGHRVLFSRRWQQGLLGKDDAPYIFIRGGDREGRHRELEGSIQISVERYLHVRANMWLSRFGSADQGLAADSAVPASEDSLQTLATETSGNEVLSVDEDMAPAFYLPEPPFRSSREFGPPAPVEEVYLLKQERRLRSKETHYIDHPVLGILIRVETLPNEQRQALAD